MKGKLFLGALLVSAVLCSQGLSATILDAVLGQNCGGCGDCNACAEPACCEPECAEPTCCEPSRGHGCDLFSGMRGLFACRKCNNGGGCNSCGDEVACCAPEPECCEPKRCAVPSCKPRCRHTGDLFTGLKGLLACGKCNGGGCGSCCEAEPCEPECCEPACGNRSGGHSILGLLDNLLGCRKSCCQTECCEPECCEPVCCRPKTKRCFHKSRCSQPSCCEDAGYSGCGGGAAPAGEPAEVQVEEAAPLPAPPQADPSASLLRSMGIYQVSSY